MAAIELGHAPNPTPHTHLPPLRYNKQMDAYIVPECRSADDTSQYDTYADSVEESARSSTPRRTWSSSASSKGPLERAPEVVVSKWRGSPLPARGHSGESAERA